MKFDLTAARVLDFDCESRPTAWIGRDRVAAEITAICSAWIVKGKARRLETRLLGEVPAHDMLTAFLERYAEADVVTGHFIRGFDLPLINAALLREGLLPLEDKLVQDTWSDLVKRRDISASQKNLADVYGVRARKLALGAVEWTEANRLTPEGRALTRRRVEGDVRQHAQLREALLDGGMLGPPRRWTSFGGRQP